MVCSRYPKEYRYYETVLKRKCLTKLKNNVWETKTKWKLVDKANYHWKNKLLRKYFSLWMVYVIERFRKEIKVRFATSFHEERLKRRGILALRKNIERNCMFRRICRKKFECNLKFRTWHQWKHYTQKRLKVKEIKVLANRIREERLTIRYIYLWSFRLNEKRSQVEAFRKITTKYETKLKEKCFNFWKLFASKKSIKKKIENLAIACHEDKVLERCFLSWKDHSVRKKRYRSQIEIIRTFYENTLINNYLEEWWETAKKVKRERRLANYQSAHNFYKRKLLQKSFGILLKSANARRRINEKTKAFNVHYEKIIISFYVNVWITRQTEKILWDIYEEKALKWRENYLTDWGLLKLVEKYNEKMKDNEEMSKVVKYSNCIIIDRAFRGWKEITIQKLHKKIKCQNACDFHSERIMQRTFKKWKEYVFKKFRKKMADEYYINTLLFKCINQWKILIEKRRMRIKEAKNLERMHKIKLLQGVFTCWRNELQMMKTKTAIAVHFYTKSKKSKVFYAWGKFTHNKLVKKNRYNSNRMILCSIIIKSALYRWHEVYLQRQSVNNNLEKFRMRKEKRLLRLCFTSWYIFVEKMKNIQEAVLYYPYMRNCLIMEECFNLLLQALELKRVAKGKEELAKRTEEKLLKRKYLKKMVSFVCWKKEKILRCMSKERRKETKENLDESVTTVKSTRRKPIIPDYLKDHPHNQQFEDELSVSEDSYKTAKFIPRKLPITDYCGTTPFLDL